MNTFYIWTVGCQMNKADSATLESALCQKGYTQASKIEDADIIVINSCAVRQSAEDKVINKLANLSPIKKVNPEAVIALMGCMVGSDTQTLRQHLPQVDFFIKPREFSELVDYAERHFSAPEFSNLDNPSVKTGPAAYVPIIYGCNNFCSYCIVPYRRGRERSRPISDIIAEAKTLVAGGIKEITLLGQNVDSYGNDLSGSVDLANLLSELNRIEELSRIRFLTSHPKDMRPKIISAIASLEKVCEHISLPAQSGDNDILKAMRRGYAIEQYVDLIKRIRAEIPEVALATDIIVGFPGETPQQFRHTYDFLKDHRFDVVHVATYSPREGTLAAKELSDDVEPDEKSRRLHLIEELQEQVSQEINSRLVGQELEVLVDGRKGNRWQSRTRTDKLVFFEDDSDHQGQLVRLKIKSAGPWSLRGTLL